MANGNGNGKKKRRRRIIYVTSSLAAIILIVFAVSAAMGALTVIAIVLTDFFVLWAIWPVAGWLRGRKTPEAVAS